MHIRFYAILERLLILQLRQSINLSEFHNIMSIKHHNVHYFNGHFYDKLTGKRIIPRPDSEFFIVAQPADFLEYDLFNTPPERVRNQKEMHDEIIAESHLEKYTLLLERDTKLFFRLGISRTDRKNEGNYYAFEIRLLEDLYLYRRKDWKPETKPACYSCCCVLDRELTGQLPFRSEQVFGQSLNDIFEKVVHLYYAGKRSSAINVFNEFRVNEIEGVRLGDLRKRVNWNSL